MQKQKLTTNKACRPKPQLTPSKTTQINRKQNFLENKEANRVFEYDNIISA
jgi:hypothetical protein